jgi:hypothetical protein
MDSEKQMAQYLLGQLGEHERVELEQRYLGDDTWFEELLAIEDELRDAYERRELSREDREAFEQRLLNLPRQKEKQQFAASLRQYLIKSRSQHVVSPRYSVKPVTNLSAGWKWLPAVLKKNRWVVLVPAFGLALAFVIASSWWLGRRSVLPSGPDASAMPGRNAGESSNAAPTPENHSQPAGEVHTPETRTMAVVLSRGLVRGGEGESKSLIIPQDVGRVRLEARFEGDYSRYDALLQTAESRRIWSQANLQAQAFRGARRVVLDVPSSLLMPGDYILTVRGLSSATPAETVAEYTFQVAKR